jgi:hypothetical protein
MPPPSRPPSIASLLSARPLGQLARRALRTLLHSTQSAYAPAQGYPHLRDVTATGCMLGPRPNQGFQLQQPQHSICTARTTLGNIDGRRPTVLRLWACLPVCLSSSNSAVSVPSLLSKS